MRVALRIRLVRWLPVLLWMGVIYFFSSQPDPFDFFKMKSQLTVSKAAHVAEYVVLAALLWRALRREPFGARTGKALVAVWLITLLYAMTDEYHQTFVAGRNGNWVDVGIDLITPTLGIILYRVRGSGTSIVKRET